MNSRANSAPQMMQQAPQAPKELSAKEEHDHIVNFLTGSISQMNFPSSQVVAPRLEEVFCGLRKYYQDLLIKELTWSE